MRITNSHVYAPEPFIVGGRTPLKTGEHPHIAEVFPHAFIPRQLVVEQIRNAIQSKKNIIIFSLPGVGKSRLITKIGEELGIPRTNYMWAVRDTFAGRLLSMRGLAILDDVRFHVPAKALEFPDIPLSSEVVGPEIGQKAIRQAIEQGKQLIIIEPPMEEEFFAQFNFDTFVLPCPSFEEFDAVFSQEQVNVRPLSFPTRELIYILTGGNFRLGRAILKLLKGPRTALTEKLLLAQQLTQEEIRSLTQATEDAHKYCLTAIWDNFIEDKDINGLINFVFLPNNGRIKSDRFWTHFSPEQQEIIVRLLHYGILVVDKDEIKFRSPLVYQAFMDYFDPNTRQSQGFMIL